jgi:hypothetical protein
MRTSFCCIALCCLTLLPQPAQAQRPERYREQYPEGYILAPVGDTILGFVRSGTNFRDQRYIQFYDEYGARTRYHADRIRGYGYEERHYKAQKTPFYFQGLLEDSVVFLLRRLDGPCKLYRFYTRRSVFSMKKGPAYYEIIEKPDGSQHDVSQNFRFRRLAGAFTDYPELARDIDQEKYKPEQIEEIVRRYNEWHLSLQADAK